MSDRSLLARVWALRENKKTLLQAEPPYGRRAVMQVRRQDRAGSKPNENWVAMQVSL